MAERRQKIRGTTLQLDQEIGLAGMLAVDVEKNNVRLFDGVLMGGYVIPNADEIALLYTLPNRLTAAGISLVGAAKSANEALENGWYFTDPSTTDQPVAATGAIQVVTATNGLYVAQTWIRSSNGDTYIRVRGAGEVWTAWKKVVDDDYLTTTAKVHDSDLLDGQDSAYYTAITTRLGYTPANKAGDTFTGAVNFDAAATFDTSVTIGTTLGVTGVATFDATPLFNSSQIGIVGAAPRIHFNQTDQNPDWYLQVNGTALFFLVDTDGDGAYDAGAYPMQLDSVSEKLLVYGATVWTAATDGPDSGLNADMLDDLHAASFALAATNFTAGNGLTGGGTLGAARTFTLGTPGSITNSTTNSVTATSHTHALGFTAAEVFTGGDAGYTTFPIGHVIAAICPATTRTAPVAMYLHASDQSYYTYLSGGAALAGTWRTRGYMSNDRTILQRTA